MNKYLFILQTQFHFAYIRICTIPLQTTFNKSSKIDCIIEPSLAQHLKKLPSKTDIKIQVFLIYKASAKSEMHLIKDLPVRGKKRLPITSVQFFVKEKLQARESYLHQIEYAIGYFHQLHILLNKSLSILPLLLFQPSIVYNIKYERSKNEFVIFRFLTEEDNSQYVQVHKVSHDQAEILINNIKDNLQRFFELINQINYRWLKV